MMLRVLDLRKFSNQELLRIVEALLKLQTQKLFQYLIKGDLRNFVVMCLKITKKYT